MHTQLNQDLILDIDQFKDVMLEAKELIDKAQRYEYNLMHVNSFDHYDFWSPYVLNDTPSDWVNSPGYKIAMLQVMSIILALRGEKKELGNNISKNQNDNKIINFLSYKNSKIKDNIYSMNKG